MLNNKPTICLAPMAGITDMPFRSICEELGADYSITEMLTSHPKLIKSEKNLSRLYFPKNTKLKVLQIIGNDANQMAKAANKYAKIGADIIDINLGCPAKKINSKGAGASLLSDLKLVKKVLSTIVNSCPIPITVKTRIGLDHNNYTLLKIGEIISNLGIKQITVHGRTKACKFSGEAEFSEITKLKLNFPNLLVIANGDINSIEKTCNVLEQTKCDGVMIGRASMGKPWLFSEIKRHFYPTVKETKQTKKYIIIKHIKKTHDFYGHEKGVRFARKHIQSYLNNLGLDKEFLLLAKQNNANEQLKQLIKILEYNI